MPNRLQWMPTGTPRIRPILNVPAMAGGYRVFAAPLRRRLASLEQCRQRSARRRTAAALFGADSLRSNNAASARPAAALRRHALRLAALGGRADARLRGHSVAGSWRRPFRFPRRTTPGSDE